MSRRFRFFLIVIIFFFCIYLVINPWTEYIFHLSLHQVQSIISRKNISEIRISTQEEKKKLQLIQNAKDFGKKLFGLKKSKSFEYYVDLHRKSLGWNLTIAPDLEMKAREFYFPVVGKFGYLGFFNEKIKNTWKNKFSAEGYDVYENEIGAYSTLGYFQDPVYSTYLDFEDNQLVRLILHEMVHEKLYFINDSDFSESMAAFMEKTASNLFFYKQVDPPADLLEKHRVFIAEYNMLEDVLEDTKKRLDKLYNTNLTEQEKKLQKKQEFDNLRKKLKGDSFRLNRYAQSISELSELNNAFLVQNSRYTPKHKNGFSILLKNCNNDITCWFDELKKMEVCDKKIRSRFSSEEMDLNTALEYCR